MSRIDRKVQRNIGWITWNYIANHPNCTRNDLYAELELFGTKEVKRVLKKSEGIYWLVRKVVKLTEDGYRTSYFYNLVPDSKFQ